MLKVSIRQDDLMHGAQCRFRAFGKVRIRLCLAQKHLVVHGREVMAMQYRHDLFVVAGQLRLARAVRKRFVGKHSMGLFVNGLYILDGSSKILQFLMTDVWAATGRGHGHSVLRASFPIALHAGAASWAPTHGRGALSHTASHCPIVVLLTRTHHSSRTRLSAIAIHGWCHAGEGKTTAGAEKNESDECTT